MQSHNREMGRGHSTPISADFKCPMFGTRQRAVSVLSNTVVLSCCGKATLFANNMKRYEIIG